ncbi:MAG: hypothetical protein IPP74_13175 [Alphaproteobacteria bacterium]|nr:hypothetical protein [Alphaproteobacteria bacterium]
MRYIHIEVTADLVAQVGKSYFHIIEPEPCHVQMLICHGESGNLALPALELLILAQRKLIKIYCEKFDTDRRILLDEHALAHYRHLLEKSEKLLAQYLEAKEVVVLG